MAKKKTAKKASRAAKPKARTVKKTTKAKVTKRAKSTKKAVKKTVKKTVKKAMKSAKTVKKKTAAKKAVKAKSSKKAPASKTSKGTSRASAKSTKTKSAYKKPALKKTVTKRAPVTKWVKPTPPEPPIPEPPTIEQLRKVKTGLTKHDRDRYRDLLLNKRKEIIGDVASMQSDARKQTEDGNVSHMPVHMADIGSDNYEQEFTLGLVESERRLLLEIDGALERLADGTYGVCIERGVPIGKARLEAKPWAKHCIEVARERDARTRW